MEKQILNILKDLIQDQEIKEKITPKTNIINDIGLDSLGMINFILKLEDEFNIELDFNNLNINHLNSVETLQEFLLTQMNGQLKV